MRFVKVLCVVMAVLAFCFANAVAFAQEQSEEVEKDTAEEAAEEIIVVATRTPQPAERVANSVSVITGEELRQSQATTVYDALRSVIGLDIVRMGGPGGVTSAFLRGTESKHTLVLIDGIEMNDPSTPNRAFDFNALTVDNVERIEILRGPQSVLYGSDAIGGVINIVTKKGKGKAQTSLTTEYGSFDSLREAATISGGNDFINYSAALSHSTTRGISSADSRNGNKEKDGYENTTFSSRLGITPSERLSLDMFLRYSQANIDLDTFDFFTSTLKDDPNNLLQNDRLHLRTQATLWAIPDVWEQVLGVSYGRTKRTNDDDPDVTFPWTRIRSRFEGRTLKADWLHHFHFGDANILTAGLETEREKAESFYDYSGSVSLFGPEKARMNSFFLQDQINIADCFFTTLGVRRDRHQEFGSETTYRVASAYLIRDIGTKFKGSWATGFRAPTLSDLYDPFAGNRDLEAEKSKGWDLGVEQSLFDKRVNVGVTYFRNRIDDLLVYDFSTWTMNNVGKAETHGFESSISYKPVAKLALWAQHTYTDAEDKTNNTKLLRRPEDKYQAGVRYRPTKNADVDLRLRYVGHRLDVGGVKLDSYTVVDLAVSRRIGSHCCVLARVENMFDRNYEEADGYGAPGIGIYGGLTVKF